LTIAHLTPNKVTEILKREKLILDDVEEIGVLKDKENDTLYQAFLIKNAIRLVKVPNSQAVEKA
jgi:hypothetical protein